MLEVVWISATTGRPDRLQVLRCGLRCRGPTHRNQGQQGRHENMATTRPELPSRRTKDQSQGGRAPHWPRQAVSCNIGHPVVFGAMQNRHRVPKDVACGPSGMYGLRAMPARSLCFGMAQISCSDKLQNLSSWHVVRNIHVGPRTRLYGAASSHVPGTRSSNISRCCEPLRPASPAGASGDKMYCIETRWFFQHARMMGESSVGHSPFACPGGL